MLRAAANSVKSTWLNKVLQIAAGMNILYILTFTEVYCLLKTKRSPMS